MTELLVQITGVKLPPMTSSFWTFIISGKSGCFCTPALPAAWAMARNSTSCWAMLRRNAGARLGFTARSRVSNWALLMVETHVPLLLPGAGVVRPSVALAQSPCRVRTGSLAGTAMPLADGAALAAGACRLAGVELFSGRLATGPVLLPLQETQLEAVGAL